MRCDRCGKERPTTGDWWSASVVNVKNGEGHRFDLCKPCAIDVSYAMQAMMSDRIERIGDGYERDRRA